MNIKGKGQRLIPEELLKYLEALKNKYPDAVDLVEANPTLEGGEDSLSSVLINGTKYAVGSGGSTLEDIVDSQGNKRFIEGQIVGKTPEPGVIVFTYGKWSLSGTHLMLVLCFYLSGTPTITEGTQLCNSINLPQWIKDKLVVQYTSNIDYKDFYAFGSANQYMKVRCIKSGGTDVIFTVGERFAPSAGQYHFRIQFDFLIDAE